MGRPQLFTIIEIYASIISTEWYLSLPLLPLDQKCSAGARVRANASGDRLLAFPNLTFTLPCLCSAGFSTLQQSHSLVHSWHTLHVRCSTSQTLDYLSPSIPPHSFAALIILSDRAAADVPRLPLSGSRKIKSKKRKLHYFLSSVPLQTSQTTGEASSVCFQLNKNTTNKTSDKKTLISLIPLSLDTCGFPYWNEWPRA